MNGSMVIQGREIGDGDLDLIRGLLARHGDWHRTRLSRELCRRWNWCNAAGQPKDMACRSLDIAEVGARGEEAALLRSLIAQYHYLGVRSAAGENLKYLVRERHGRLLGCVCFAAAAWRCAGRDEFIGWTDEARKRNLWLVANNTRFLVVPWVRVENLASHLLSRVTARVGRDWEEKYGPGIYALETFVERSRFTGACYRAANWRCIPGPILAGGIAGPRLSAFVGFLKGRCHTSYTTIETLMDEVFGQRLCRGTLTKIVTSRVSPALAPVYDELLKRLPSEPYLGIDETGHKENGEKFWTWCFRAPESTLFRIDQTRSTEVLRQLLGSAFDGVISPHISRSFVARARRVLPGGHGSHLARCSRMDILQTGRGGFRALLVVLSALAAERA